MQSVPITTNVVSSWQGVLDTTLYDKVVSDLGQVGSFLRFPPPIALYVNI